MFHLRANSFFSLVLFGMTVVLLPLLVVLLSSSMLMDRLVRHSSASLHRSVAVSQLSQTLQEQTTNQERRLRQYQVLGARDLHEGIVFQHKAITSTIDTLRTFSLAGERQALLDELHDIEKAIFAAFERAGSSQTFLVSNDDFARMGSLTDRIYQLSQQGVYGEVETLHREEKRAEKILFALASTGLPLTILLAFVLTRLITRPVQQIEQGLDLLGSGDFSSEIRVSGPKDLVFLGKKLNWLRRKLAMYEQEKNKFASHISHELKTPLASIHEAAELLGDEVGGPLTEGQREVIDILRKNCGQLRSLIENLVGLTMAQAGKNALHLGEFSLDALVSQILVVYKPAILNKGLLVQTALEPMTVQADRQRLESALDNLVSNAVKYTPPQGTIALSLSRHGDDAVFEIHDSGPGVPEEEREQIFNPFYQGSVLCKSHVKGSGLGLAIAREYVSAHNGSLTLVRPEEPGACFRIILPAASNG